MGTTISLAIVAKAKLILESETIRRARVRTATVPSANGQPMAGGQINTKEILQAQYARGEITREQYKLRKQELG